MNSVKMKIWIINEESEAMKKMMPDHSQWIRKRNSMISEGINAAGPLRLIGKLIGRD